MVLLPQTELCPFHGSAGLVSLAGKITWLVLNLSLPSCCSSLMKLTASAYGLLWFLCCCFPCVCNKSLMKNVDWLFFELDVESLLRTPQLVVLRCGIPT